jgi:hypothetical protein
MAFLQYQLLLRYTGTELDRYRLNITFGSATEIDVLFLFWFVSLLYLKPKSNFYGFFPEQISIEEIST